MACSNTDFLRNRYNKQFVQIPCRWCMSCRVDTREQWSDRFNFERYTAAVQGFPSSYVTFTYDDEHYPRNGSLSKDEGRKFIFRLRDTLKYHNVPLPSNKFKYILVGEYGGTSGRVHLHGLFTGLDYALAKPYFEKAWNYRGTIDSLPLLPGAVRYVLKYVDKQQHGDQITELYVKNGLEPPFKLSSLSLGKAFFDSNNQYILENNGYYHQGKIRPLPPYYAHLAGLHSTSATELHNDSHTLDNFYSQWRFAAQNGLTRDKMIETQSYFYEKSLLKQALDSGLSVNPSYTDWHKYHDTTDFKSAVRQLQFYKDYKVFDF